jgi:hypothetical protein
VSPQTEDKTLSTTFGIIRDDVIARLSKFHTMRDLVMCTLYQICLMIKSVRFKWACSSRHGRDENCLGKSEGNTPVGRSGSRSEVDVEWI